MEVAALGLRVDSATVPQATQQLDQLTGAAYRAERAADGLGDQADQTARQTAGMGREANQAGGAFTRMAASIRGALGALSLLAGVAFAGAGLVALSDNYTKLANQMRIVAGEQGDVNEMLAQLDGIASRTRAPLQATAQLYQRISISAGELGASQEQVLRFTENVGLALAQQGGSASQSAGALMQLSQAMGGGVVRAEEFNSILEGAYPIALAAARGIEETGGSVAKLRQMMLAGEITSQRFFEAILSQTDELESAFASTVPTIGQAFGRLTDSLTLFLGRLNETSGIGEGVARFILLLSDNLNTLAGIAIAAALAFTASLVPAIFAAVTATGALSAALIFLRRTLIATGIGALVVGVGLLIGAFLDLSEAVGGFGNAFALVLDLANEVWQRMQLGAAALYETFLALTGNITLAFQEAFASILVFFSSFIDQILDGLRQAFLSSGNFAGAAAVEASRAAIQSSAAQAAETAQNNVATQRAIVQEHTETARTMTQQALAPLESWNAITSAIAAARESIAAAGGDVTGAAPAFDFAEATQNAQEYIAALRQQREEIGLTGLALKKLEIDRASIAAAGTGFSSTIDAEGALLISALERQAADDRAKALEREIAALGRQAVALAAYGDNRTVLMARMDLEDRRRQEIIASGQQLTEAEIQSLSQLTDSEWQAYEGALRANLAFERQVAIFDALRGPVEQYNSALRETAALVDAGLISGADARRVLRETDLMQGRRQLESFLPRDPQSEGFSKFGSDFMDQRQDLEDQQDDLMAIIDGLEQAQYWGLDSARKASEMRIALEEETKNEILRIQRETFAGQLATASQGFGQLAGVLETAYGRQSGIYKAALLAQEGFAIASAMVNIELAMSNALALPFPANLPAMAMVAANAATIISSIMSLRTGFSGKGFMDGGYTGPGAANDVAGLVHAGEVVWSQRDVARAGGWQSVDNMRTNGVPMAANDNRGGVNLSVKVENHAPGVTHEVRQISETEVEVIARRVAPDAVAGAIANPNSQVSKALKNNVAAPRRRA